MFALDFSKAFDTVRHTTFMEKMTNLSLCDDIYNWINDLFIGHSHCTKFMGTTSEFVDILASVIQSSALGPASFIVTASDLQPIHAGNALVKFADDTYVVVPAVNSNTCASELAHVQTWADGDNLKLNWSKLKEIIFTGRRPPGSAEVPPCMGIPQVHSITALGVVLNDKMNAADHVSLLLTP